LEQELVVRPAEGGEQTDRLFQLLWAKWQFKEKAAAPAAGLAMPAGVQIKLAIAKVANIFWEPGLSPVIKPPLRVQIARYWLALVASLLLIGGVGALQFSGDPHLTFAPFFLAPCVILAWKADRRLGIILACVAGITGPLMQHLRQPLVITMNVTAWNMAMGEFVFIFVVILLDNIRKQSLRDSSPHRLPEPSAIHAISGNWAVVLVTSIYFALVVALDVLTNPYCLFLPLYLLPCVIFTLTLNWRWGAAAAVIASVGGPLTERFEDPGYQLLSVEVWNTFMGLAIFLTVVLLLDRVRHKNILFSASYQ
jgi:hypothetical protein